MTEMRFLRLGEVVEATRLSASTIRRLERAGEFPRRRRLGTAAVGWVEKEVVGWMRSREVVAANKADD